MGPGSAPPPPGWVPPSGGRAVMADRYCFENEYGEKICTDSPKFREEYIKETQLPYRFWEDKRSEELLRGPQGYPYGPDYPQNQYDPRYQQFLRRGYGR